MKMKLKVVFPEHVNIPVLENGQNAKDVQENFIASVQACQLPKAIAKERLLHMSAIDANKQ